MISRGETDATILRTKRLELRPLSAEDADELHRISNKPLVRRYLWDNAPVSRAVIADIIARSIRMFSTEGLGLFGVRLRGEELLLGFRGFLRMEGMEEPELATS
jgi:RimJ/RimL family protein N-acetyltransferase